MAQYYKWTVYGRNADGSEVLVLWVGRPYDLLPEHIRSRFIRWGEGVPLSWPQVFRVVQDARRGG